MSMAGGFIARPKAVKERGTSVPKFKFGTPREARGLSSNNQWALA
jgi:hypothetical protein